MAGPTNRITRWTCPHCGQTVTLHIRPSGPPICHHRNQPTGHKPTVMELNEPTG